jgi:signal transduction histidine kinase
MRERAELFGGTVEIESSPQQGTRIRVRVPFE